MKFICLQTGSPARKASLPINSGRYLNCVANWRIYEYQALNSGLVGNKFREDSKLNGSEKLLNTLNKSQVLKVLQRYII